MTLYVRKPYARRSLRPYAISAANYDEKPGIFFPIDVKLDDDTYQISAVLPGVKAEDLEVEIVNESVTIKGEIFKKIEENDNFLLQERNFGKFERTLTLPVALDSKKAEAELKDGILYLNVPKSEEAKPKVIKINSK